jgi:hypothetical protein
MAGALTFLLLRLYICPFLVMLIPYFWRVSRVLHDSQYWTDPSPLQGQGIEIPLFP